MTQDPAIRPGPRSSAATRRSVIAATIGNALEWYDLIIYAFFAPAIARTFFPADDPGTSLLLAFATFGVSFLVRPIGGIVLGAYADRAGRKSALLVGMSMMMVGTLLMMVTPGKTEIGVAAPILIVIARLLQGFSAGGEFGSATAFLAEQSNGRRAYFASWQFASQGLAMMLGSGLGIGVSLLIGSAEVAAWGWRLPFLFGLLIGPMALYLRRRVDESPEFTSEAVAKESLVATLANQKVDILMGYGAVVLATVALYMILYLPTYSEKILRLPADAGLLATLIAGLILLIATPLFGMVADHVGVAVLAPVAATSMLLLAVPLFAWLAAEPTVVKVIVVQAVVAVAAAAYLGAIGALLTGLYPVSSRSTAISLSYNLSVMSFGGLAPVAMTWLIAETQWIAAPSYYLAVASMISLAALAAIRRRGTLGHQTMDQRDARATLS